MALAKKSTPRIRPKAVCDFCGHEFVSRGNLNKHLEQIHKEQKVNAKSISLPPPHHVELVQPNEEISIEPVVGNRCSIKAKGKANQHSTNADQMSQPEVTQRPTRTTRHTSNGNMTKVSFCVLIETYMMLIL